MTRLRGLLALLVLVVAVAGVPWGLARFGDWPLDGIPTGQQVGDLTDTLVSDATVFAVLTVAAWLVWGLFMVSLLVEVAAAARGVRAPRVALAGPLQRSASTLVAAVVLAVSVNHPVPAASAAPAHPAATVEVPPALDPDATQPAANRHHTAPSPTPPAATIVAREPPPAAEAEAPVVLVRPGDTPWSIAEAHLGDGMAWRTLWDLNRDRPQPDGRTWRDPQLIRPGWQLRLPGPPPPTPAEVHVVEPGDTLSGIAAEHLGDPDRYPDIFAANTGIPQPAGGQLSDPDLILPGWRLALPTPDHEHTAEHDPSPEPDPPPAPAADSAEGPPPEPPPPAADVTPRHDADPPTDPPATPAPATAPPAVDARPEPAAPGWTDALPTVAGLTGAVVLASGLAAQVHRLRRRRAARSATLTRALPEPLRHTETAVAAAADVALTTWAGHAIARLVASLNPDTLAAAPVAVELSDAAGIELLWTNPQPGAPAPWQEADGGWAWRLPYDPDQPVPAAALPAGIPALVTIGRRDGRQLLVDLEAYGTIGVTGDPKRVEAFLRAITVELATSTDLADAYVHSAGLTIDPAPFDRLTASTPEHAAEHLAATRASVSQALERARAATTFAARAGSSTPIEANVAIVVPSDGDQARRLIDATSPGRGVGLVIATDAPTPARIELPVDGPARIEPLGVAFDPVCLPAESAENITQLLDALHDLDEPPAPLPAAAPSPGPDPRIDSSATADLGPPPDGDRIGPVAGDEPQLFPAEAPAPDGPPALVVRVLGRPSVPDRPGLGRRELIVTALLACRAGPVPASAVQDALWGGKPVEPKTVWNLIGATRTALGELADGTPVLPAADRVHQTLRLAPGVTTDLALLRTLVQRANQAPSSEAVSLLGDALALVEGPPFDAPGFDWAHRDQDVAEASTLIVQAAEHLVEVALDTGQVDVARDAVLRALRGLPGNEELYRLRMRVEHHAGNLPGVAAAYDELVAFLLDLDTEPSPATTGLYRELLPSPSRR